MKFKLIIKTGLFTLLLPGVVTIITPCFILTAAGENNLPAFNTLTIFSLVTGLAGAAILFYSIWGFAYYGRGTLAAIDPPTILMVRGFYRYTRNLMYLAVLCILLSEAIFFASLYLLVYTGFVFLVFHFYVLFYEEPHLQKVFGDEYKEYLKTIPRWGISFRAFTKNN